VFAPQWGSMPPAPRVGRSKSLGTGDACLRGTAFGYEPVRLKLRGLGKKVARYNWRSILPGDLTLIHGRGMSGTSQAKGEKAGTWPHENWFQ
jgi:hypothetical protein